MQTVLVTADAVRADHLGQYGYQRDTMPVLDRLVAGGSQIGPVYANGPHTGVSIPSLLTGRYLGVRALSSGPTIGTAMSDAGCQTAAFHSNTMVIDILANAHGFDDIEDFGLSDDDGTSGVSVSQPIGRRLIHAIKSLAGRRVRNNAAIQSLYNRLVPAHHRFDFQVYVDAATVTDRALSWIEEHTHDDFFCWIHYMDPHRPYGVGPEPPRYVDRVPDDAALRSLMARAGRTPGSVSAEDRELLVDLYDSELRYTSRHLERLIDGIDRLAGLPDTLLVFTADHGEEFGEHGKYFHRNLPYDELLRVPLIISPPSNHPEDTFEGLTGQRQLLDIGPTLCTIQDVPVPNTFEGDPLRTGDARTIFATGALDFDQSVVAVREPRWKYIRVGTTREELYDLDVDPDERRNLSDTNPAKASSLRERLPNGLKGDLDNDVPSRLSATSGETRRRLEALGYLE